MTKYFIGAVGALLGILAGAWLMLAPTALAYQPAGAGWVDATKVDFWSGAGLILLSVAGLVMFILGLVEELKDLGIIERKEKQPEPQEEAAPESAEEPASRQTDVEQVLLPLVNAMLKDMQDQQRRGNGAVYQNNSTSRQVDTERRAG